MLGGKPIPAAVLAELRHHARRVARLHRLKQLAIDQQDGDALERSERLLSREHARHATRMWQQPADQTPEQDDKK